MHLLIIAAIITAFVSGFLPQSNTPDQRMNLAPQATTLVRLRSEISSTNELKFKNVVKQQFDYSCGSAALATLLNFGLGENLGEKQVIRGMLKHGDKEQIKKIRAFSLLDMKQICSVLGYEGAGYKAELEDLKNPDYWPCIVPIKLFEYRHFVVLKGIHDRHVFIADPFKGNISYTLPQFLEAWFNHVIFLVSPEKLKDSTNLLKLSKADLCYITEDTAWDMINNRMEPYEFPVYLERDDIKGENQYYRP
ncbi:MAG: C39 family peptidase [Thermodesulfobacteriota bacterium]|nr:C39 family peptidase [Thermodesulfobacteriota bacterium]